MNPNADILTTLDWIKNKLESSGGVLDMYPV